MDNTKSKLRFELYTHIHVRSLDGPLIWQFYTYSILE
jgi:hypothetical protein